MGVVTLLIELICVPHDLGLTRVRGELCVVGLRKCQRGL